MADYYPLIARAVAGLERNSGEGRRALYERARAALVAQLRGVSPALNESDVTRERLALEEAIRKVEAESARQPSIRTPARVKAPEFPRVEEPDLARAEDPEPESPRRSPAVARRADARAASQPTARRPAARAEDLDLAQEADLQPPPRRYATMPRPDGRTAPPPPRRTDDDVADEPDEQPRRPAANARADARQANGARPPRPSADRTSTDRTSADRPSVDRTSADRMSDRLPAARPPGERPAPDRLANERSANERPANERAANERVSNDRAQGDRRAGPETGLRGTVSEASQLGGASARAARSAREQMAAVPAPAADAGRGKSRPPQPPQETYLSLEDIAEPMLEPSFLDEPRPLPQQRQRQAPPRSETSREPKPGRSIAELIKIGVSLAIVAAFAVLLLLAWPYMSDLYRSLRSPAPQDQAGDTTSPNAGTPGGDTAKDAAGQRKNSDRFSGGAAPAALDSAVVAQHAVLLEEDPNDPKGRHSVGSVVWRTDAVAAANNKAPELAVRADIEIPERGMGVTWTLKRDADPNRSTSHTIEVIFKLPPDFPAGGILNVPGIWMKPTEQAQGSPLAGLAVKVTNNYFLIGLSAAPADRDRNVQLLKELPWFDVAILYANNKRAILSLEKGTPGDRAFQQAFAAWDKQ